MNQKVALSLLTTVPLGIAVVVLVYTGTSSSAFPSSSTDHETSAGHYWLSTQPVEGGNAQAVEPHEPHTPDLAETYSVSSPDESMAFWEEHGFEDVPGLPIPVDDSYHHNEVAPETE